MLSGVSFQDDNEGNTIVICDDCQCIDGLFAIVRGIGIGNRDSGWEFDQDSDLENAAYIWCSYCKTVSEMDIKGGTVIDSNVAVEG